MDVKEWGAVGSMCSARVIEILYFSVLFIIAFRALKHCAQLCSFCAANVMYTTYIIIAIINPYVKVVHT